MKDKIWAQLIIIYTRYMLGGAFIFASIVKIKGGRFTLESGAENPINSAWHFFETMYQSGIYWRFIGISQLLAGLLLMTQRYARLGALVNFPIILNIFMITISYDFRGTPIITGMMLLANLMLLLWDWNTFRVLLNQAPVIENKSRIEHDNIWALLGLALFSFTFIYRLANVKYDLILWLGICVLIGVAGLIIGLRKIKTTKILKKENS